MMTIENEHLNSSRYMVRDDEFNQKQNASADANESIDVVDFAFTKVVHDHDQQHRKQSAQRMHTTQIDEKNIKRTNEFHCPLLVPNQRNAPAPLTAEKATTLASHLWTASIDRKIARFQFPRKKSEPNVAIKERTKFVRCSSIARLFGNTYSTQQSLQLNQQQHKDDTHTMSSTATATNSLNKCRPLKCERFKKRTDSQIENIVAPDTDHNGNHPTYTTIDSRDFCAEEKDLSSRAFRSLSKSLGRLWRRSHSVEISPPDPEYKVLYLGNVLTGWAKGDACVEKPLTTLWRNYTQNHKPDVVMRIQVCPSGLKATTRQHGLTEYWSNRITHCNSPKNYPRIFCWIYRHEGRKLKHELRCHAVLCPKETIAEQICKTLKENISRALLEFKRDKINRQNARLSLVNSVYDNPSMPRRKILLSVGANNYRPPMERSKSAPKLMAIEEAVGEEEEETNDANEKSEESRPSCCRVVDPLYPAMTLGRKHCRRGHSIRRSKNTAERMRCVSFDDKITITQDECGFGTYHKRTDDEFDEMPKHTADAECKRKMENNEKRNIARCSTGGGDDDDEDEFNSLLMVNDYDAQSSLSGELMSYFDSKLKLKSAVSLSDLTAKANAEHVSMTTELYGNRIALSLDNLDQYSDEGSENDSNGKYRPQHYYDDDDNEGDEDDDGIDDNERSATFFNQNEIIDCLVNVSQKSKNGDEQNRAAAEASLKQQTTAGPIALDSDEGSISSGCETSSTVTTTHFDDVLRGERDSLPTNEPHLCAMNRQDLLMTAAGKTIRQNEATKRAGMATKNSIDGKCAVGNEEDCNSEMSDESGFDEYQNFVGKTTNLLISHEVNGNSINNKNSNNTNIIVGIGINDVIDNNTCNSQFNNNSSNNCRPFNGETNNKEPIRLMINIPKNAKSILI